MDLIQMIFHFYWFFGFSANSIAVAFVETPDPYASNLSGLLPWFIFALIVVAATAFFAARRLRGMNILQVVKTIWQQIKGNNNVRPVNPGTQRNSVVHQVLSELPFRAEDAQLGHRSRSTEVQPRNP
jgi:xanthosine utilization system XapX-like protein